MILLHINQKSHGTNPKGISSAQCSVNWFIKNELGIVCDINTLNVHNVAYMYMVIVVGLHSLGPPR